MNELYVCLSRKTVSGLEGQSLRGLGHLGPVPPVVRVERYWSRESNDTRIKMGLENQNSSDIFNKYSEVNN